MNNLNVYKYVLQNKNPVNTGLKYKMEEPAGFEPAITVLQTGALPLGYGSITIQ